MKTLNQLREEIKSNVADVINYASLSQVEINELDVDAVCELLENNEYYHEVIYCADAWEIVAGSSFDNYVAEGLDFSSCTSALDCVMQEANSILSSAYYGEREDIIQDYLDGIQTEDAVDESNIVIKQSEITSKQSEIDNFEYECSESDFDEMLDDCHETYNLGGMTFYPSDILKSCDPIAYRCSKSDYESNYDLDDCEEYTDLKDELESLENQLSELESELSDLQDELESLESDSED